MSATPTDSAGTSRARANRAARLILIGALLLGALLSLVLFGFEVCRETTETVTSDVSATVATTTASCGPPSATDGVSLVLFALIGLLLWPDVAEFGIFGFSVKRKADEAVAKSQAAAKQVEEIERHVVAQDVRIDMAVSSVASSSSDTHFYFTDADRAREVAERLPRKAKAFEDGEPYVDDPLPAVKSDLTDQKVGELVRTWAELNRRLGRPTLRPARRGDVIVTNLVSDFIEHFMRELQLVRSIRNAIAHGASVPPAEVDNAIDVAHTLLRILDEEQVDHDPLAD